MEACLPRWHGSAQPHASQCRTSEMIPTHIRRLLVEYCSEIEFSQREKTREGRIVHQCWGNTRTHRPSASGSCVRHAGCDLSP